MKTFTVHILCGKYIWWKCTYRKLLASASAVLIWNLPSGVSLCFTVALHWHRIHAYEWEWGKIHECLISAFELLELRERLVWNIHAVLTRHVSFNIGVPRLILFTVECQTHFTFVHVQSGVVSPVCSALSSVCQQLKLHMSAGPHWAFVFLLRFLTSRQEMGCFPHLLCMAKRTSCIPPPRWTMPQ